MSKKSKIIILTIVILVLFSAFSAVGWVLLRVDKNMISPNANETTSYDVNFNLSDPSNEIYKKEYKFKEVIGWIASFDYQNGKNSFYKNISKFTQVSPVYFDLNTDGSTSERSVAGDTDLKNIARKNSVKVIPTIIGFDENALQAMLNDDKKFQAHQEFLLKEAEKYDGLDIDYESINLTDKELYLKMLQNLAEGLHSKGKILTVSVISKDKENGYQTLIETRQVQDWNRMGNFVDQIRIMAYDYSPDSTPGPISPLNWVENVIRYGLSKTAQEKLVLGQPLYAYAYGNKRYAYTYDEIAEILNAQVINLTFDKLTSEKMFTFSKGSESRRMWFQDFETMLPRFALINRYNIAGIAYWRLGGEDQRIYDLLAKQR